MLHLQLATRLQQIPLFLMQLDNITERFEAAFSPLFIFINFWLSIVLPFLTLSSTTIKRSNLHSQRTTQK